MCGILIVLAKTGPLDRDACHRALATMEGRGPDFAFSRVWEERLFIGQTVLSITGDPREGQGRYHRSPSQRYEVLYNGELYNFRELARRFLDGDAASRYGTDTEVLAALHDALELAQIPPLLDGMYAYAVFDAQAKRLHLVRDVQGEKSLYLYEDARWIVVASEIEAIRAVVPGIALDPQALRDYFRTRHLMLFERTVHQGIRQLGPGRLETLDLDSLAWSGRETSPLRDWIDPQRLLENAARPLESLVDELDHLLSRCVQEMIPDARHFAAVVSGGIDSSLIARYLMQHAAPDRLVAVHHVGKDVISDDLSGFERVLGRPIEIIRVDAAAYAADIARCQRAAGAPLHTHAFVGQALQSQRVREAGCRVLFGGDGGDELFGGYPAYAEAHEPTGRFSPSPYTAHHEPRLAFLEDRPAPFQEALAAAWADALDAYRCVESPRERAALAMMYCDAAHQLPEVGLRGADLMSMMESVETRSVYLRRPIVEFALNLPAAMKVRWGPGEPPLLRTKVLLKRLFLRYFSTELLLPKQGFAGFPNESASALGAARDFLALDLLGVQGGSLDAAWADRDTAWKLINMEWFLRHGHQQWQHERSDSTVHVR